MIDEIASGFASNNASHCFAKFGVFVSPAFGGISGPHLLRNVRTASSLAASRIGAGPGIHRLIWKLPSLTARNCLAQSRISSDDKSSAPHAPIPPALATAIDKEGGQAPAIGARRMGIRSLNSVQNESVRRRTEKVFAAISPVFNDAANDQSGKSLGASRRLQERGLAANDANKMPWDRSLLKRSYRRSQFLPGHCITNEHVICFPNGQHLDGST